MEHKIKLLFWTLAIILLLDIYVFQAVKTIGKKLSPLRRKVLFSSFWLTTVVTVFTILVSVFTQPAEWNVFFRVYLPGFIFALYFSKILFLLFLIIDDVRRLFHWSFISIKGKFATKKIEIEKPKEKNKISRSLFLSQMGIVVAGTPFISLINGMVDNAYNYQFRRHTIKLPNLPNEFHGMKIVQISDIHSGSFTKTEPLINAVKLINQEKANLVFFTGDLVNDRAIEADKYVDVFKNIQAENGVFSTFGNHDYGDYVEWDSVRHKEENLEKLADTHQRLGWKLLRNENFILEKNKEQLGIIGVENWGAFGRFSKYGDLKKAYRGIENAPVKLLLSHDPSHWDAQVRKEYKDIDMMFAGHTHGMQFGIEIPGFRWSPVQYFYKQWADLYKEENQFLYVNRGFGFLGYPGRVGILPEVTVFTLEKG